MNSRVICNTGPLIALSVIDRIDILHHLFKHVAVPEEVHKEILEGGAENSGLVNYRKVRWIKFFLAIFAPLRETSTCVHQRIIKR